MSNIAISLDFRDNDITYEELRRFVKATEDEPGSDQVWIETNENFEIVGFKAWV